MTDENKDSKEFPKEVEVPPTQEKPVMVQDIINNYPVDRERVRDTLFINISNSLNRIANTLEYFVTQDAAERKVNAATKKKEADNG